MVLFVYKYDGMTGVHDFNIILQRYKNKTLYYNLYKFSSSARICERRRLWEKTGYPGKTHVIK